MMKCSTLRRGHVCASLALLAGFALPPAASAETDLSKFPLMKSVPADAFVAVAARSNPERKFLDDYWGEVSKAFRESGIVEDVLDMFTDMVPDENLDQVEEAVERFLELGKAVDWEDLCAKEMVHAGRFRPELMAQMGSPYEGMLLFRMDKEKAKSNYASLKAILDQVVALVKDAGEGEVPIAVTETKVGDATLAYLGFKLGPEAPPFQVIGVGYRGDVVIISFCAEKLVTESVGLMKGGSETEALVKTKRFEAAFKSLPQAEDSISFFDVKGFMRGIAGIASVAIGFAGPDEDAQRAGKLINQIIEDMSICDYSATVEWTEGYRVFTDNVAVLTPNAKSSPLYGVIVNGQSVSDFDKFVPSEADSFECTTGIDWSAMYHYIVGFLKANIPESEEFLARWDEMQKEWEFNLDKDLLGLIEGPITFYAMDDHFVVMFKVSDEDKMRTQVNRMIEQINKGMGQQGGLMMTPVTVAGDKKFMQVSHPMMMMMAGGMSPIWGCAEGHFILGTSTSIVKTCLETGMGKHPRISKNKRFKAEGLVPKSGTAESVSYADESKMADRLQEAVGGMTMAMGFVGMMVQGAPPEVQTVMKSLPQLLGKLGPVVAEFDFYQSSAKCSSFAGDRWIVHSVQNYKPPTKKEESTDKSKESEAESESDS